jgi:hypothetical protein
MTLAAVGGSRVAVGYDGRLTSPEFEAGAGRRRVETTVFMLSEFELLLI